MICKSCNHPMRNHDIHRDGTYYCNDCNDLCENLKED